MRESLADHNKKIMDDLEAIANDRSGDFWPSAIALGTLRIIRALEAEVRKQTDMIDVIEVNRQNHLERRIEAEKERDKLKAENTELEKFHRDGADDETISELLKTRKERNELKAENTECHNINKEMSVRSAKDLSNMARELETLVAERDELKAENARHKCNYEHSIAYCNKCGWVPHVTVMKIVDERDELKAQFHDLQIACKDALTENSGLERTIKNLREQISLQASGKVL